MWYGDRHGQEAGFVRRVSVKRCSSCMGLNIEITKILTQESVSKWGIYG